MTTKHNAGLLRPASCGRDSQPIYPCQYSIPYHQVKAELLRDAKTLRAYRKLARWYRRARNRILRRKA